MPDYTITSNSNPFDQNLNTNSVVNFAQIGMTGHDSLFQVDFIVTMPDQNNFRAGYFYVNSLLGILSSIELASYYGTPYALKASGNINLLSLPTAPSGLNAGDVWIDTTAGLNILKVV